MQSKNDPVYSVIDIGTNTCLLLIASLQNNELIKIFEAQEIPRLGKDVFRTGHLSQEGIGNTFDVIKDYILLSEKYNAGRIFAFGTCALRDAENSNEFVEQVFRETGISITVLSGEQEARYGFQGAIYDLDTSRDYAVIDVGGGSTEISFMKEKKFHSESLNIGALRLKENRFDFESSILPVFKERKVNFQRLDKSENHMEEKLSRMNLEVKDKFLAGIAGTITTLCAINEGLDHFEEDLIHGKELKKTEIEEIFDRLKSMSEGQRLSLGAFMRGRSDIIVYGTFIYLMIMNCLKKDGIVVSTKGLRYGLMINVDDFF